MLYFLIRDNLGVQNICISLKKIVLLFLFLNFMTSVFFVITNYSHKRLYSIGKFSIRPMNKNLRMVNALHPNTLNRNLSPSFAFKHMRSIVANSYEIKYIAINSR